MKEKTLTSISLFFKQLFLNGTIIFFFSVLQFYWSMGEFSNSMSSACLSCSFLEEVIPMSLITAIFLTIQHSIIIAFIKKIIIKIVFQSFSLIAIWFFWDYNIFVSRESSWSSYSFNEEIYYVINYSLLPIIILSFVLIFSINYSKNIMKINSNLINEK